MKLGRALLFFAVLAAVSFSSATSVSQQAEQAIAEFKAKFDALFGSNADGTMKDSLCSYTAEGAKFDWSSLKGKTFEGGDPTDGDHYLYKLTMCDVSPDPACAATKGSICQYDKWDNSFSSSMASFTASPAPTFSLIKPNDPAAGVEAVFTNGDKCRSGFSTIDPTLKLRLTCGSENVMQVDEPTDCVFVVEFANKASCHGSGEDGMSGGSIFLIVLMVGALLYVIVGCGICMKKYEKTGLEACPHKTFWFALPGLFKDGCAFSFGKIRNLCGSKTITTSAGDYESA